LAQNRDGRLGEGVTLAEAGLGDMETAAGLKILEKLQEQLKWL